MPRSIPKGRDNSEVLAVALRVTDGFLEALQVPILSGRDFSEGDSARAPIVSESLARRLFGTDEAVGQHIRVVARPENAALEIIGIAADASLGDPRNSERSVMYLNYWQEDTRFQQYSVETTMRRVSLVSFERSLPAAVASTH